MAHTWVTDAQATTRPVRIVAEIHWWTGSLALNPPRIGAFLNGIIIDSSYYLLIGRHLALKD
jgi:hypothetical protein